MLANRIRIAAFRGKDAPPIGQLYGRHPVWGLQHFVQHRGGGRSCGAISRQRNRGKLRWLLAGKAELDAPAGTILVTMPWRRQISATLTPGCSDSNTTAKFLSSVKLRRFERPLCGGSASRAAVKSLSGEPSLAALLAPVLIFGRALG
jgi:hypothetical protein